MSAARKNVMEIGWFLTALTVVVGVSLLIGMAVSFSWPLLIGAILVIIVAIALGLCSLAMMEEVEKDGSTAIFSNQAEQEILSRQQREILRTARAEVLMELALTDVEKEKENIAYRQTHDAYDEAKPPHNTSFTNLDGSPRQIDRKRDRYDNYN